MGHERRNALRRLHHHRRKEGSLTKLLYVFPEPLPLDRARGIQTTYTVRALAAQGIDVVLAHVPGTSDPFSACGLTMPGNVERIAVSHHLMWPFERVHSTRVFFSRLTQRIQWNSIGAVFSRHLKIARALLDRFPSLPLVYEAHEVFSDTAPAARRAAIEKLEGEVLERAAAVIANSKATSERLAARHFVEKRIHVVPNGVEYPACVPEKDWAHARQHVVYAGSFFGWKGVDDLATAARELAGFRIRLIGGDDASIARLRARVTGAGAEVELNGRIPHDAVAQALARACIAVLPNRADTDSTFTSPIKLFEYMAAGCAIVASDIPALREVLEDGDAEWFPAGNAAALADAIRALADAPERARAMAARLREKARRYTWDARGEQLARVLAPLLTHA